VNLIQFSVLALLKCRSQGSYSSGYLTDFRM
jgi:hypothetical protein